MIRWLISSAVAYLLFWFLWAALYEVYRWHAVPVWWSALLGALGLGFVVSVVMTFVMCWREWGSR
jgi:hypothetical protein